MMVYHRTKYLVLNSRIPYNTNISYNEFPEHTPRTNSEKLVAQIGPTRNVTRAHLASVVLTAGPPRSLQTVIHVHLTFPAISNKAQGVDKVIIRFIRVGRSVFV